MFKRTILASVLALAIAAPVDAETRDQLFPWGPDSYSNCMRETIGGMREETDKQYAKRLRGAKKWCKMHHREYQESKSGNKGK